MLTKLFPTNLPQTLGMFQFRFGVQSGPVSDRMYVLPFILALRRHDHGCLQILLRAPILMHLVHLKPRPDVDAVLSRRHGVHLERFCTMPDWLRHFRDVGKKRKGNGPRTHTSRVNEHVRSSNEPRGVRTRKKHSAGMACTDQRTLSNVAFVEKQAPAMTNSMRRAEWNLEYVSSTELRSAGFGVRQGNVLLFSSCLLEVPYRWRHYNIYCTIKVLTTEAY